MAKRYDISAPRPGKDDKTYWQRIGTAWENEKGIQLVFDALPIPDAEGRCTARLFEPRDNQRSRPDPQSRESAQSQRRRDDYDDEGPVPF